MYYIIGSSDDKAEKEEDITDWELIKYTKSFYLIEHVISNISGFDKEYPNLKHLQIIDEKYYVRYYFYKIGFVATEDNIKVATSVEFIQNIFRQNNKGWAKFYPIGPEAFKHARETKNKKFLFPYVNENFKKKINNAPDSQVGDQKSSRT